jgi:RHS repeat-associated protein
VSAGNASWSIGYDANGNRSSVTLNGAPSAYTTAATSNRLESINNPARSFKYDNAGHTVEDTSSGNASSSYTASYNLAGRLETLTRAGVTESFAHNANGARIRKFSSTGAASTVLFAYDQSGQLLGEYDATGKALREYIWLGTTPVAMFTPDPANAANPPLVYFIHADHIDTPRVVVDKNNKTRWRWLAEPFGTTAPETNPSGLGAFTQNLRFPGQYADQETGLNYNYFRDYDPSLGRYVQSDPIGLAGGVNTYAYVGGNPLRDADPEGLQGATTVDSWCTQNPVVCAEINGPKSVPNPSKILPITQELTKDRCPPGDPDGKDPCKGLRKQLELHEQKLRDYVNNPLKYDNRGDLSNALLGNNAAQANRIYEGRLKELRSQIENWKREIQKCEEKMDVNRIDLVMLQRVFNKIFNFFRGFKNYPCGS